MAAKRPAQYELDEKTLDPKVPTPNDEESSQPNQSQPERNILAVKKDTDNDSKPSQNANETQPKPTNGLFSNLFNQPTATNGSGLFSNGSTGLFNNKSSLFNNNTGSGLFAKPSGLFPSSSETTNQPKKGGLFGNSATSGGSIFNFQNGGVPPVKQGSLFGATAGGHGNDEDDSGDSAQLEAAQNLDADPTKSKINYNYESTCSLVLKQKAFKFKKIGSDLIENVDVAITYDKSKQLYYISVQLPATKKSIYSGVLIGKKSQVKHLNNKKENVEISAFNFVKGKPEQGVLRCQFEKESQGIEVHDTVDQIIKETYVLKEEENGKSEQKGVEVKKDEVQKQEVKKEEGKKEDDDKKGEGQKKEK